MRPSLVFANRLWANRRGATAITVTLMMTFIAIEFANWAIDGLWPQGASNQTAYVPGNSTLPNNDLGSSFRPTSLRSCRLLYRWGIGSPTGAISRDPRSLRCLVMPTP